MEKINKRFFLINLAGIGFLLAGLIISIIVLCDFYQANHGSVHFDKNSKFEDLGTVLSGTAGLMFTIAGVLFFTYTLYQTSAEMRQTQNILSTQLSESTFFNLIKHHKETYTDNKNVYDTFTNEVNEMFNRFELFESELKSRFFEIQHTRWQPTSIFIDFKHITNFSDSILHIIRYVQSSLQDNARFYHETLYNNLSQQERIIIGIILKHRIERVDMSNFRNYVNDYTSRRPQIVLDDLEFPSLSSTIEDFYRKKILISSLDNKEEAMQILEKETTFYFRVPEACKLKSINAHVIAPSAELKKVPLGQESGTSDKFNLAPVFTTNVLKDIRNKSNVRVRIVSTLSYGGKEYKIKLCEYSINSGFQMQVDLTVAVNQKDRLVTKSKDYISFEQIIHNTLDQ